MRYTRIFFTCGFALAGLLCLPARGFTISPEKPVYYYRDDEVCHQFPLQEITWSSCDYYPNYLNSIDCARAGLGIGCVEYLDTLTPTLRWHIDDPDSSTIYYELQIFKSWWDQGGQQFSKVIDYTSDLLSPGDCTFSVGQSSGTYNQGYYLSALGTWGVAETYYWKIRGCDENECGSWLWNGNGSSDYEKPAFQIPADFIGAEGNMTVLYKPTSSSIEIAVNTPFMLDSFAIEYGPTESLGSATAAQTNVSGMIKTAVTALEENRLYYYRPTWSRNNTGYAGAVNHFRTARRKSSSFTFTIVSDWHTTDTLGSDLQGGLASLSSALRSHGPDFIIDTGDFVNADAGNAFSQDIMDAVFLRGFWISTQLFTTIPVMHVSGNHEAINQFYGKPGCENFFDSWLCKPFLNQPVMLAGESWKKYYSHYSTGNQEGTYYSWEWGDAKFIVLDPFLYTTEWPASCNTGQPYTLGPQQQQWYAQEVQSSDKKWTFVFIHHLLNGAEPDGFDNFCYARGSSVPFNMETGSTLQEIINPLAHVNDAIIFTGHDHVFAREIREGLLLVSCPSNLRQQKLAWGTWDWYAHGYSNPSLQMVNRDDAVDAATDINLYQDTIAIAGTFYDALSNGDRIRFDNTAGTLPVGRPEGGPEVFLDNYYYAQKIGSQGNLGLITIYSNPDLQGGQPIDITDAGSGVHTLSDYYAIKGHTVVEVHPTHVRHYLVDNDGAIIPTDVDEDGVTDHIDNCPVHSNPQQQDADCDGRGDACDDSPTCTPGVDCDDDCDGVYSHLDNCPIAANPSQDDSRPPQGNGIGDACDCEGDSNCDSDVDGTDAQAFKLHFGRSVFSNPCESGNPCNGDFSCDGDVDGSDAQTFKGDFGRNTFFKPCPPCTTGAWCSYR